MKAPVLVFLFILCSFFGGKSFGQTKLKSLPSSAVPTSAARKSENKQVLNNPKAKKVKTPANAVKTNSNQSVQEVVVIGNRKIEKDAILAKIKTQVGQSLSPESVHQDVLSIYELGFFYNVKVDKTDVPGGVRLAYEVFEKPSVTEIVYQGMSEVSEEDIKEAAGLKTFEILDVSRIQTAVQKIEKMYEENGYYLAQVKFELEDIKAAETQRLIFRIQENDKVKVRRIAFIGNRKLKDKEITDVLRTQADGLLSAGSYRQEVFDRDVDIIQRLYFSKGYLQAKIGKPEVSVTADKKFIFISIRIEEGEQFSVGEIDFTGDLLFSREELIEALKIDESGVFNYETLMGDVLSLQAKYGDLGYAFANINPRTSLREKDKLADVTFEFEKGNKVYFGEINVVGNSKTRDKVVRREFQVRETELYNETRKRESLANVRRLGFFEDVTINQKARAEEPDKVDLDVVVKERNTGSIQVGAGYSTFQKFIFNGQIQQSNLFGKGQRLGLSLELSQFNEFYSLNFFEPYVYDSKWSFGFDLYRRVRTLVPFREVKTGGSITVGHPLAPYLNGFIRYKNDFTELDLRQPDGDPLIYPVETSNGRTSSATFTLEYDRRNDRMTPSDGVYGSSSVEYAGLGGDLKYTKSFLTARYYKPLFWDLVFRNNLVYGIISSPSGAPPFNELFVLGGANSLRGYLWNSVGKKKKNSQGVDVIYGGTQQLFYNGEIEFPLVPEAAIRGVMFYDIGQADDWIANDKFRSDLGFGFRWFSPIGPLRFEWGFPIGRKADEAPVNFEFSIGSPF